MNLVLLPPPWSVLMKVVGDLHTTSYGTAEHVGSFARGEVIVDGVVHILKVLICEHHRAYQPGHFVLHTSLVATSGLPAFKLGKHTSFAVIICELVLVEDCKVLVGVVVLVQS